MEKLIIELREAGYTEDQVAKEVRYLERVALENERIGYDRAWNYGFVGPNDSVDCI